MKLIANNSLEFYIRKKTRESRLGFVGCLFIFIFISFAFYYNIANQSLVIINLVILAIFTCLLIRSIVAIEASNINSIISCIDIAEEISIQTFGYRLLFYTLPPQNFKIKKAQFNLIKVKFPFNSQGLETKETYRLRINQNDLFLIYKSFPVELEKELNLEY